MNLSKFNQMIVDNNRSNKIIKILIKNIWKKYKMIKLIN